MVVAVSGMIVWSLVYRATLRNNTSFMVLRAITAARLDAIVYGLLMAVAERRYGAVLRRNQGKIATAAVIVIIAHVPLFAEPESLGNIYGRVLALPVFSLAVAALLPFVSQAHRGPPSIVGRFVRLTSERAYTLCIVHIVVAASVNVLLHTTSLAVQAVVYVVASYAVAGLFSAAIERPFMRLRPGQLPASAGT